jgi:hypothetical protein
MTRARADPVCVVVLFARRDGIDFALTNVQRPVLAEFRDPEIGTA